MGPYGEQGRGSTGPSKNQSSSDTEETREVLENAERKSSRSWLWQLNKFLAVSPVVGWGRGGRIIEDFLLCCWNCKKVEQNRAGKLPII